MADQRRVIFLNRFFYPDHSPTSELLADVAFALATRGFDVSVISSRQSYEKADAELSSRASIGGVEVHRVWTSKRGRRRLHGRSLDYLTFYLSAAWRMLREAKAGDIIVAKTDPPLLSVPMALVAKLKGALLVNWLQDIFPEVAERLGVGGRLGSLASRALTPLRDWSLRSAAVNVVVGQTMARRLAQLGLPPDQIETIGNWADGDLIAPLSRENVELRKQWIPDGRFVVCYAGNLGRPHDIDTMLAAMSLLQQRAAQRPQNIAAKIMFVFVGGGAQRPRLEEGVSRRGLTNVCLRPYQPRQRLGETLAIGDVHLVSLSPDLEGLIVPSKFYGVAAAGRPTIFIGAEDGELARLLAEHACGVTVPPGDGEALANRIAELAQDPALCDEMGKRARKAFESHWNKDMGVAKWEALLRRVGKLGRGEKRGEDETYAARQSAPSRLGVTEPSQ